MVLYHIIFSDHGLDSLLDAVVLYSRGEADFDGVHFIGVFEQFARHAYRNYDVFLIEFLLYGIDSTDGDDV